jgi:hypothetical protein
MAQSKGILAVILAALLLVSGLSPSCLPGSANPATSDLRSSGASPTSSDDTDCCTHCSCCHALAVVQTYDRQTVLEPSGPATPTRPRDNEPLFPIGFDRPPRA